MPEEAFLRGVVPTVGFPGHRLAKLVITYDIYKRVAGVMAALVGMNKRFGV
jgi:hypothetical protein